MANRKRPIQMKFYVTEDGKTACILLWVCCFVSPNRILLLIFVRSFGTVTYAKIDTSFNALRTGFLQGCRS